MSLIIKSSLIDDDELPAIVVLLGRTLSSSAVSVLLIVSSITHSRKIHCSGEDACTCNIKSL